jgi:hypothetical protein
MTKREIADTCFTRLLLSPETSMSLTIFLFGERTPKRLSNVQVALKWLIDRGLVYSQRQAVQGWAKYEVFPNVKEFINANGAHFRSKRFDEKFDTIRIAKSF